ncbi:MAG: signal peptidase I [Acidimicrobiales bacterium]
MTISAQWSWFRVIAGAAVAIALVVLWLSFAPTHLGGDAIYVVTSGISMEPLFHTGDLAILRPGPPYHVGEIVGYLAPRIGIVLHRIIGVANGHFVMKGDNNHFIDPYRPLPSDVVGRLWLHVPKVGRLITTPARRELVAITVSAALVGMMSVPAARRGRRGRGGVPGHGTVKKRGGRSRQPGRSSRAATPVLGLAGQVVASIAAILALASLALGAVAFTHRTTTTATQKFSYRQVGSWTYRAPARGDVYGGGAATTGQPVFSKVAPVIHVRFAYRFDAVSSRGASGHGRLSVLLSSPDGWSRTIITGTESSISNGALVLRTAVDLRSIESLVTSIQAQIGQTASTVGTYLITVQAEVDAHGVIAAVAPVRATFDPGLGFTLLGGVAQLDLGQGVGAPTPEAQVLGPTASGTVNIPAESKAVLSLLGSHPSVLTARRVAEWGLAAAVVLLLLLGLARWLAAKSDEVDRIDARYRSLLLGVEQLDGRVEEGAVRVTSIDDLANVAAHEGRMILYGDLGANRRYVVKGDALTYEYVVRLESRAGRRDGKMSYASDDEPPSAPTASTGVAGPERASLDGGST